MRIGWAFTGSFCTLDAACRAMEGLLAQGHEITPIFSENVASLDTRFGTAKSFSDRVEGLCGRRAIRGIVEAERIGPKDMFELLCVAPCTGNTLAKLALSITDNTVTMAVKSHMRSGKKPLLIALATNDALAGTLSNIAELSRRKNVVFAPLKMDAPDSKPFSLVCDFTRLGDYIGGGDLIIGG